MAGSYINVVYLGDPNGTKVPQRNHTCVPKHFGEQGQSFTEKCILEFL